MIKAVIFDLWGVLTLKKHFLFDEIRKDLKLADAPHPFFAGLLEKMELGTLDEASFWQAFGKELGKDISAYHVRPWRDYYQIITIPNQPLLAIAAQLKHQGYKLAVLSNVDRAGAEHAKVLHVFDAFDAVVPSYKIGIRKPDPQAYQITLDNLGVKPQEAVFIDDRADNIRAAETLGIHGIVFKDVAQTKKRLDKILV